MLARASRFAPGVLAVMLICGLAGAREQVKSPIKVRWLVAHEPIDAFRRAAKTFSDELAKESHGQMALEVLTPKDVGSKSANLDPKQIFKLLNSGAVELSQTVTTGIGEIQPQFWVLDLPFLFKNHEHASKVLEGPIGQKLLASLEKSHVRGLAFTYSGGFRIVPSSERAIHRAGDFAGLRVRTTHSPVAQETLRILGAEPVMLTLEESKQAISEKRTDAAEATYIRVDSVVGNKRKYINETFHSLFLTSILVSDRFYNSLSKENQTALTRAAVSAGRIEREDSIRDGEKAKREFEKEGAQIVTMTPSAEMEFKQKVQPVYGKFDHLFSRSLVSEIQAQAGP